MAVASTLFLSSHSLYLARARAHARGRVFMAHVSYTRGELFKFGSCKLHKLHNSLAIGCLLFHSCAMNWHAGRCVCIAYLRSRLQVESAIKSEVCRRSQCTVILSSLFLFLFHLGLVYPRSSHFQIKYIFVLPLSGSWQNTNYLVYFLPRGVFLIVKGDEHTSMVQNKIHLDFHLPQFNFLAQFLHF